ncbi:MULTISPECIES: type I restriction enzyme HsdR N-terminal domain-containing protein [Desulfosediminicola]|uniref:type I restriction enzyme HsdR N-terminal domain-containing protein n=1 Tax=Desulfosediminicola TaxID=2886823 RepID=UPI0010AD99F5|nr:type I restriction enzyme HsdR N-terminal domain-containing protein [Desulfosediminicola ganghwensis]
MSEKISHHLVYGTLEDYLNGEELTDTDDERIRQRLSRMMVEEKGYGKNELQPRRFIETLFSRCYVRSTIELTLHLAGRDFLILRYGPGSLVSRERAAVAAARVLNPDYEIPLAVVTNGRDAELIDTSTGKILGYGLHSIPDRKSAELMLDNLVFPPPRKDKRRERELRILNAFDVERCCM